MADRYEYAVDVDDPNSNFAQILEAVAPGSHVLDVGCAVGHLAQALTRHRTCDVVGVELSPAMAAEARDRGVDVLTLDVTERDAPGKVLAHTGGRRFDVVIFADVLEHLTDPVAALRAVSRLLTPTGVVVASIPNVAHASIRLDLFRGRFAYTEAGLLDRTHVQLYTIARIMADFPEGGFQVETVDRSLAPVGVEGRIGPGELPDELIAAALADPEAWVYQYVVTARRAWDLGALADGRAATAPNAVGEADVVALVPSGTDVERWDVALRLGLGAARRPAVVEYEPDTDPTAQLASVRRDALVMITGSADPDPRWLVPLLEAGADEVAGIRLLDETGTVVQAGADADGRPIGVGDPDGHGPLYSHDRFDVPLLPPLAGPASRLGTGSPRGHYLGGQAATTSAPAADAAVAPADLSRYSGGVLALAATAPAQLPRGARELVLRLADELRSEGRTLALWWPDGSPAVHRSTSRRFERRGVLLLGGNAFADRTTPGIAGVAASLAPAALLRLDAATSDAMDAAALRAPRAVRFDVSDDPIATAEHVLAVDDPATATAIRAATPAAGTPPRIPALSVRSREAHTSIVIPVWNRWDLTSACLDAIREHTPEPHRIVVVDNASTDETPLRLAERSDLTVITNGRNLGFAGGTNAGLAAATGSTLVLMNNDTEVTPGWLSELLRALDDPSVGFVGPRSNSISGPQLVPGAPGLDDVVGAHDFARRWHEARRGTTWPIERLVGFCLAGRAEVWEELGSLDEGVGLGNFEDDDLCSRARASGYRLRVADGAMVLHHGSATFRSEDVDVTASLLAGARHVAGRHRTRAELASLVVLGDGVPWRTAASLDLAWSVADAAVILERRATESTTLATAGASVPTRVQTVDWQQPDRFHAALRSIRSAHTIVVGAGERLVTDDHGLVRRELDALRGHPIELETPDGPQVRVVPPTDATSLLGRSTVRSSTLRIANL